MSPDRPSKICRGIYLFSANQFINRIVNRFAISPLRTSPVRERLFSSAIAVGVVHFVSESGAWGAFPSGEGGPPIGGG